MPNITVREYNPESGALMGNISVLKFGTVESGTRTQVKVIDFAFDEVAYVGNIKLGLVTSGGLTVNASPEGLDEDGSASNGNFGIESTLTFDASKASSALSRNFPGSNGSASASSENNVFVGSRNDAISKYIYLDIKIDNSVNGEVNGAYKVFFDYS